MSALDISDGTSAAQINYATQNSGRDLPATFSEGFNAAFSDGQLFSQSIAKENARAGVLSDYLDEIKQKTGKDLSQQFVPDTAGGGQTGVTDFTRANDAVTKMKEDYPDLNLDPLNDDEIERRAVAKSRAAADGYAAFAAREKTGGGVAGGILGGVAAAATDPVNLLALAVAPEAEIGILGSALRWGGIAGASQAAIEAIGSGYREEVQPGYAASGQAAENVLGAAAFGAGLGGLTKALGNLWTRAKTGAWPTSVRDAGNVLESEANVANSNPFPNAEGEAAHNTALSKTIDDITQGRAPDVGDIVTPDIAASADERLRPILDARDQASSALDAARDAAPSGPTPELPFEQNAAQAEAADRIDALSDQVTRLAQASGYAMPKVEAEALATRLANMDDPVQFARELDRLQSNPSLASEPLPKPDLEPRPPEPIEVPKLEDQAQQAALRSGLDQARMTNDVQVHMGADADGKPITQSLDSLMNGIDADREAADHIEGCINPAPQEKAA